MPAENNTILETKPRRVIRLIAGILMGMQSGLLLMASIGFGILALFFGGLSAIVSGASVSDEKYEQTWNMIFLGITLPFVWTAFMAIATFYLMIGKRAMIIVVCCMLAIGTQAIFLHWLAKAPFMILLELPALIPAIGMAVGVVMAVQRPAPELQ